MPLRDRCRITGLTIAALLLVAPAPPTGASAAGLAAPLPNDQRTIAHVLNRIAFGPRPGDVERVSRIGLAAYIDQQLSPARIDDHAMEARLAGLETLKMSSLDIAREFFIPAQLARRQQRNRDNTAAPAPTPPPDEMRKQRQVIVELSDQKITRAVYSERQLQEVLVDFWFNHFNVFAGKGIDRILLTEYERETIRPHVLGKFRDLLEATAKSPAMLFYLDNWLSADPNGPHDVGFAGRRPANRPGPNGQKRGLNENYARELMELHTLGVDGGYTQKDIVELARCFTGWTMVRPGPGREAMGRQQGLRRGRRGMSFGPSGDDLFFFDPRIHDDGEKIVLGHRIKGGGMNDGRQVLDILARHPSTAAFIATKLVRRFVADAPPPALVEKTARRFRDSDGDLREVVRTILTSPEFVASEAYRAKVKTPFEFVVSALRATGAGMDRATPLVQTLQQLGQPLYMCQPPTGYSDKAEAWVNSGALINRMNFAVALAGGRVPGIRVDAKTALGVDPDANLDQLRERMLSVLLGNEASEATRATLARAGDVQQLAALTIGSPEFQRR
jgi:uncharacterized protein (DUF1800 family)